MEAKTKKILLITGGVLAVGAIGFLIYKSTKKGNLSDGMMGELTDEEISRLSESGTGGTQYTTTEIVGKIPVSSLPNQSGVPVAVTPPITDKKEIIQTWKADKAQIKAVCGRRRILGQAKRDWLACVAREGGDSNDPYYGFDGGDFDGGGNYVEVGNGLTDLN